MSENPIFDPRLLKAYRRRRAPSGFATRVVARAESVPATGYVGWRAVATAVVVVAAVALYLSPWPAQRTTGPDAPELRLPTSPDYWAEITVPGEVSVPDLSEIGEVPLFPAELGLEGAQPGQDRRSSSPTGRHYRLASSSQSNQQETIHESI